MFFGGLTIATNGFSMVFDFATIAFNGFRWFRTIGQTMRWFRWIVVVQQAVNCKNVTTIERYFPITKYRFWFCFSAAVLHLSVYLFVPTYGMHTVLLPYSYGLYLFICFFVSCQSPPAFIWMSCKKHQIVVGMATRLVFCNHHHHCHQEQPSKIISQYHCHYICGG